MWVVMHPSVGIVFDEVLVILTLVSPVGFHLTQLTKAMVGRTLSTGQLSGGTSLSFSFC